MSLENLCIIYIQFKYNSNIHGYYLTLSKLTDYSNARLYKLNSVLTQHCPWLRSHEWRRYDKKQYCNWNEFNINASISGWHRRLNHRVGVSPAFHLLIRELHNEAREVAEQVVLVSELSLRRIQRKHYRQSQAKLFEAWDR